MVGVGVTDGVGVGVRYPSGVGVAVGDGVAGMVGITEQVGDGEGGGVMVGVAVGVTGRQTGAPRGRSPFPPKYTLVTPLTAHSPDDSRNIPNPEVPEPE